MPTDIQWTLPGIVFKSYTTTLAEGKLNNLVAGDLDNQTVTFYWADVGNGRTVRVTFKINEDSCTKEATFNVKDPTVEFPTI
ncbi:MAG: hypothetical protein WD176_09555, partial [Pirellulales bacterium]